MTATSSTEDQTEQNIVLTSTSARNPHSCRRHPSSPPTDAHHQLLCSSLLRRPSLRLPSLHTHQLSIRSHSYRGCGKDRSLGGGCLQTRARRLAGGRKQGHGRHVPSTGKSSNSSSSSSWTVLFALCCWSVEGVPVEVVEMGFVVEAAEEGFFDMMV